MTIDIHFLVSPVFLIAVFFLCLQNTLKFRKYRGNDKPALAKRILINLLVYFAFPLTVYWIVKDWVPDPYGKGIIVFIALGISVYHLYSIRKVIDGFGKK